MRTESKTQIIRNCKVEHNKEGHIIGFKQIGKQEITITDIYADEGKILVEKATGKVMSDHITLGTGDSVENYDEIEKGVIV